MLKRRRQEAHECAQGERGGATRERGPVRARSADNSRPSAQSPAHPLLMLSALDLRHATRHRVQAEGHRPGTTYHAASTRAVQLPPGRRVAAKLDERDHCWDRLSSNSTMRGVRLGKTQEGPDRGRQKENVAARTRVAPRSARVRCNDDSPENRDRRTGGSSTSHDMTLTVLWHLLRGFADRQLSWRFDVLSVISKGPGAVTEPAVVRQVEVRGGRTD